MTQPLTPLRETLTDLDALVISQPQNRRYLSGFTGSAGILIISPDHALLATDFRYYTQGAQEAPAFELAEVGYDLLGNLPGLLSRIDARKVGFESQHLTVAELDAWRRVTPGVEWVATTGRVETLRAVKTETEIETLKHAVRVADEAFARATRGLRPGATERDLAWAIKTALYEIDGREPSFDLIVAAGPASAKPHARPSDAVIPLGVPIVIDMGALVDGYHSDMTRTIVLGEPDAKFRDIYTLVLNALETAEAGIRPGVTGARVDALARDIIAAAGHGDRFGHGLGHGVGLAIHEGPRLSFTAGDAPLEEGMAVTVEPGVYLPDWGGVRVEDIAIVRQTGAEILTHTPKDLNAQIIPI